MPIYEYKCDQCGSVFEKREKFSDEPLTTHPDCGGPVPRLISAPALMFKGSGWYVTDYAKGGNGSPNSGGTKESTSSSDSKSESKSDSKSESKTESKSESKAETKTESKPAASTPATTSSSSDKK
jgi:putative FmdB family regulatory protein